MAFRVLNQISSIRQIATKNFRSLSADRSSLIPLTSNNGIRVIEETPQKYQIFHRRSLSQPPILIRNRSSSQNEASEDELTTTKGEVQENQDFGNDSSKLKQELVQAVLSQQEYTTKVADRITSPTDDNNIPRYILSCAEEKFSPERLDFINQQKTISLLSYAKSNSSLQPSRMNNSSNVYKTELLKSIQQKSKPIIGENSSRDYSTMSTINTNQITTEYFISDIIEETQRQILLPSRDHIQNLLTIATTSNSIQDITFLNQCNTNNILNILLPNHEPQVKTSLNKNCQQKNFLVRTILENIQKRQISTFYNYEDPDCPRPRISKHAPQPKTCVTGKFMDKHTRQDCPPPPKTPTPPPIPLPRIPKRLIPEPPLVCPRADVCPERADINFKVKEKTLPCLNIGNCPCIEPEPLKEGCPFPRLKKKLIPPPPIRKCLTEDECPPRADDCYKIKMKDLPCLVPGDCDCIPAPLKEGPPLPRLKARPVPNPIAKLCLFEDPCPPRADAGLVVKPKKLRCLAPSTCPCIEPPTLREYNPLPRLKKSKVCEPLRLHCDDTDACPERADNLCNYKILEKKLPTMILCQNHVSAWEYNAHATKRRFSSFAANNFLSRSSFIKNDIKHMCFSQKEKYVKYLCDKHKAQKYIKNKPCEEICPKLPTICPKLRRLVKKYPTVEPCKIEEKPECFPNICRRADLEADVKRKKLPCLKAKCGVPPCTPAPVSMKLVKLKKRFHYKDPVRKCPLGCNKKLALADNICGYEVRKKKLKPILPCLPNDLHQSRHFHTTPIRESKNKVKKEKRMKCKKPSKEGKSKCISFKVNCPPRARESCKVGHKYKDCQKQNSPYKSFSECANHEIIETITECQKLNYLQPRNPIIAPIVIQPAPPPKHAHIDPRDEEMCIYKKLCKPYKGHIYDCDSFNKPRFPLRQMDFEAPERVPCPIEEDLKKSRKKKDCPAKEVEKCPEVSYKICETDVCSKPKRAAEKKTEKCKVPEKKKEKEKCKEPEKKEDKCKKKECKERTLPSSKSEKKKESKTEKDCEKEREKEKECEKKRQREQERECEKERQREQERQCEKQKQLEKEKQCEKEKQLKKEKQCATKKERDMCETRKEVCCKKAETVAPSSAKRKSCDKVTACDLLKPPPTPPKCAKPKPTSIVDRLCNFFKAKPNCPDPNDWKKKHLLKQAEKAAKAAGMDLCKPKSTGKCKKAPAKGCTKSPNKCDSPEDVCKNVCEKQLKKNKPDCSSKRHYSKSASSKHSGKTQKDSGKKCKAPPLVCGLKKDDSKKAKKEEYKRESKPACGKESPKCEKTDIDPCNVKPYHNCPKRARKSCRERFVQKDCCYIRAPYDCYSDMQKRFPSLPINECLEQDFRIRQLRDKPIRPQDKNKKKKSKDDKCRKHYSTYCPTRPFSSTITSRDFINNLDIDFNAVEMDYLLFKNILKDNFFDDFEDFSGLTEYDTLFYDYPK